MDSKTLAAAVEELVAIPYFPAGQGAKTAIAAQIGRFVSDPKKLRWLVDAAINAMSEWRGVSELRGLYCTRHKPADGVEGWCSLPGYTPEDSEASYAKQIYKSNWEELPEGNPFEADLEALAKQKRLI